MYKNISIDISGIESQLVQSLKQNYTEDIKVVHQGDDTVHLELPTALHDELIVSALDKFLGHFKHKNMHELIPLWVFDETNSIIKGPSKKFFLTRKEVVFLKLLLNNDTIVTYKDMIAAVWEDNKDVTKNAMRLFTRNIRKKLPPKVLKNFQGVGYKLVL
jgi:hypothetical protein